MVNLFGFEFEFGRGCPDCEKKDRELAICREQGRMMGENSVELLDEIHKLKAEKAAWLERTKAHAKAMADLADLRRVG